MHGETQRVTSGSALNELRHAIRAFELHHETFEHTHKAVIALLKQEGIAQKTAQAIADSWLSQGDFYCLLSRTALTL